MTKSFTRRVFYGSTMIFTSDFVQDVNSDECCDKPCSGADNKFDKWQNIYLPMWHIEM